MHHDTGKEKIKVLFMDDEIHDSGAATVNEAISELRKAGCEVTVTDKMSDTVEAFENEYYDVFVLDIDMHKIPDAFQNKRGTMAANIFKSLDNDSAIILYSAAGTIEDLFTAANLHVYGFIYKNEDDAVRKLVYKVNEAALSPGGRAMILPQPRKEGRILIADSSLNFLSLDKFNLLISQLGDYQADFCPLDQMPGYLSAKDYCAGILLTEKISTRPRHIKLMDAVFSVQPFPQVVAGYSGFSNQDPILFYLVNAKPFRLINLSDGGLDEVIFNSLKKALLWYGGNETFQAESKYIQNASAEIDWEALRHELTDI